MITQARVTISGRVQGVWYRASTKNKAEQLGLTGWVKNTTDGRVEAVFEGEKQRINEMIVWCSIGPSQAKVKGVKVDNQKELRKQEFEEFSIVY